MAFANSKRKQRDRPVHRNEITMEVSSMGMDQEVEQIVFLRGIWESARAQGLAEGRAIARAEAMATLLRDLLQTKFGELPKWVDARLKKATEAELWAKRVLSASSLEAVIGKR